MILNEHAFADERRIDDITQHLIRDLNIKAGRDVLLILQDFDSQSNYQAVYKWTQREVWLSLRELGYVDLCQLKDNLADSLERSLYVF